MPIKDVLTTSGRRRIGGFNNNRYLLEDRGRGGARKWALQRFGGDPPPSVPTSLGGRPGAARPATRLELASDRKIVPVDWRQCVFSDW